MDKLVKILQELTLFVKVQIGGDGTVLHSGSAAVNNVNYLILKTSATTTFSAIKDENDVDVPMISTPVPAGTIIKAQNGNRIKSFTMDASGACVGVK